jgi:polysaccharide export outer membrane protein
MSARPATLPLLLVAALAAGCAAVGDYVWVESAMPGRQRTDADFVIAPGDVLGVRVSGQDALSSKALVRADGKISLPLVNDQLAEGLTPGTLAQLLDAQYKTFIKNPVVTVVLEQRHADRVSVVGAVANPGTYTLTPGAGVLQALALGGGITPYAHRDRIFVLRREEAGRPPLRIRFRYQALLRAERPSASFDLRDGDVVVVE